MPIVSKGAGAVHLLRHPDHVCCVGLVILWLFPAFQIAKIGVILGNLALGFSTLQALYVNRMLLPPALRPGVFLQAGTACCGSFFLAISFAVMFTL